MSKINFEKKDEKNVRGISKAIWIIAKISRILITIGAVCLALVMIAVPFFINKIDIKDNKIIFNGMGDIVEVDGKRSNELKLDDIDISSKEVKMVLSKIEDIFNNNSKGTIIFFIEFILTIGLVQLIINIIVFKYLEKVFKNVNKEDTPFTIDNVEYLRKMAWLIIVSIIIGVVSKSVGSVISKGDVSLNVDLFSVLEALFIFSMAYIFKYGVSLQEKSKTKMISNNDD